MGMTRRIKKIADAFYGRLGAYRGAQTREALAAAFLRNIYGEEPAQAAAADHLADYALSVRARLAGADMASGAFGFGPIAPLTEGLPS